MASTILWIFHTSKTCLNNEKKTIDSAYTGLLSVLPLGDQQQPAAYDDPSAHEDLRTERLRGIIYRNGLLAGLLHLPDSDRYVHEEVQLQVRNRLRTSPGGVGRPSFLPCSYHKGVLGIPVHILRDCGRNVLPRDCCESVCGCIGRRVICPSQTQSGSVVQRSWSFCRRHVPQQARPQRKYIYT